MTRIRTLITVVHVFAMVAVAQQPLEYFLPAGTTYDPTIPTPESFFGFQVGKWHLTPHQIHAYMKALDDASERISLEEFGRSYEDRPMVLLIITSVENQRSISSIREKHLQLSDPAISTSISLESMPVVVWMGYSVHGNESSGSNASVLVAYHLAASRGPEIEAMLRECVVLLNPSINPDGLNRFATWANAHKGLGPVTDPANREHNEVWPGGRGNHYWFDLNRDWMPVQHPETRGRLRQYYSWRPNVLTDHHEMGTNSTFFFQPGVTSRENPFTPPETRTLTSKIATFHEEALNQSGSLYYSEEGFDDFYIGKGSSYPDITGGIGILFEQASSRGHLQESPNGTLTFSFTIRNQVTTSLSTLKAARALRKDLLEHQRTFFRTALRDAGRSSTKAYVFGLESDKARTGHLVNLLKTHHVVVHPLKKSVRAGGMTFQPGSAFLVPVEQPQFRLISSLFDRRTNFSDSLFYDVSSWTLPYAFGVPFAELASFDRSALGLPTAEPEEFKGSFVGPRDTYAYIFEWNDYYAPRTLNRLLEAGVLARVATKPFEAMIASGQRFFDYGTILIPLTLQREKRDTINALLDLAILEDGITVYSLQTGRTPTGIDLGSGDFEPLKKPSVALVAGNGVSSTDAGEAWHLLDRRMHMEVSLIDPQRLGQLRLDRYTAVVISGGSAIDSAGKASLKRWVELGGILLGLEQGADWIISNKLVPLKLRAEDSKKDSVPPAQRYADLEASNRAKAFPGSIFEVTYDRTHPLLYGYRDEPLYVIRTSGIILEPSKNAFATPVRYSAKPLAAGYMNSVHAKRIGGSAAVVVSAVQNGRVILFSDNPNFRAFWLGASKLFLNGIFFGSAISTGSGRSEETE